MSVNRAQLHADADAVAAQRIERTGRGWVFPHSRNKCVAAAVESAVETSVGTSGRDLLEGLKKSTERITGWQRPTSEQIAGLLRRSKRGMFRFRDDGKIPNHPRWPVIIYWNAVQLPRTLDPAAIMEDLFAENGWRESWRNGIYDYVHYHSRIHEVLGVARGSARVRLGGDRGRTFKLSAGDIVILPAGTGHQCLAASSDFLVVGAYPRSGTYDECRPDLEEHDRAAKSVAKAKRPCKDPAFGAKGPLLKLWKLRT
jgi:uncharacterized protein YjlB